MEWADGRRRCRWANPKNQRYLDYHDHEWGQPVHEDRKLFEMLLLECFQAGLSWECVLNKREAFRRAFDGFDPVRVAGYDAAKRQALCADAGIIRNRRKIDAAVGNAGVFLAIQREWGSFDAYLWSWTQGQVLHERDRTNSPLSDAVSADLRARGMRFVGTTVVYAYLAGGRGDRVPRGGLFPRRGSKTDGAAAPNRQRRRTHEAAAGGPQGRHLRIL